MPSRYTAYSACAPQAAVDIRRAHSGHSAGTQGVPSRCPSATWQQADRLSRPLVGIPQALCRHWTATSLSAGLARVHSAIF